MAIERMKSVWLFAPHGSAREVLDRLAAMGITHVSDCGLAEEQDYERLGIERVYPDAGDIERRVQLLRESLETLSAFKRTKRQFLENFIPTPVEVRAADVRQALDEVPVEEIHAEVKKQEQAYNALCADLQKAQDSLKAMADLQGLRGNIVGVKEQRYTAAFLAVMSITNFERLRRDERLPEASAVALAAQRKRRVVVQAVSAAADRDDLLALLREYGADLIPPEEETVTIRAHLARRREEVKRARAKLMESKKELTQIAAENRSKVEIALGYWEERLRIVNATALLAESKRLTIIRCYVREADIKEFRGRMAADLPDVAVDVRDPVAGEAVPVSLRNSRLYAPTEFLVGMFGRPNYFTFDPTPYIAASFLIFFGICFGDAIYGTMLILFGTLLARKYRDYPGPRGMFRLLALAGVTTTIVGVLTGAWASDLLDAKYLGEGNPLAVMREKLMVADMIDKAMAGLAIALLLGVANQFLSLICLMVRNVRQGDTKAAIFDGGFWLLVLPAVVVGAAGIFGGVPGVVNTVAFTAAGVGAAGLILTQGRAEKTFVGKAVIGVVSLYGIVGSYGITAFIGDILSYSRLLALGLTTSIVGFSFNLIGGMAKGIPYIGFIIFIVVLMLGHGMNFLISILGAFVHSARLIFVEFFGKFYQGDAVAFAPIGTWSGRIRAVDSRTIWPDDHGEQR